MYASQNKETKVHASKHLHKINLCYMEMGNKFSPSGTSVVDVWPDDIKELLGSKRKNMSIKFGNGASLPVYISSGTPNEIDDNYSEYFGYRREKFSKIKQRLWLSPINVEQLTEDGSEDLEMIKDIYSSLLSPDVKITVGEFLQVLNFTSFLYHFLHTREEYALYLENGYRFLFTQDGKVLSPLDLSKLRATKDPVATERAYGIRPKWWMEMFTNKFNSLNKTPIDIVHLGTLAKDDRNVLEENALPSIAIPSCPYGTHALLVSKNGASKMIRSILPVRMTLITFLAHTTLSRYELVPGIVSHDKLWDKKYIKTFKPCPGRSRSLNRNAIGAGAAALLGGAALYGLGNLSSSRIKRRKVRKTPLPYKRRSKRRKTKR